MTAESSNCDTSYLFSLSNAADGSVRIIEQAWSSSADIWDVADEQLAMTNSKITYNRHFMR